MYFVTDQQNIKMALISRNVILDPKGEKVLGITVGDCLFNSQSKVFGKIINSQAYDLKGAIIGKIVLSNPALTTHITQEQTNTSWQILTKIKEHTCPWIAISTEWSLLTFTDHLG